MAGILSASVAKRSGSPVLLAFMAAALTFAAVCGYMILESLARARSGPHETLGTLPEIERQASLDQAKAALERDPLALSPLKNMAVLYDLTGDKARSQELTVLLGRRSLRDLPVQAAVLQILMDRKDYSGALYRLDGLLRSKPERTAELIAAVASFAETEASLAPLVDILVQNPPWRYELLALLGQKSDRIESTYRLLSALRKTASPVTNHELRPFLGALVASGDFEKAYYVWLDFLSDAELRKVAPVFDGNFDLDIGNRFFDWTHQPLKNVDLRIVPRAPGSADKVLRLDFASGRTPFANFSQLLRLDAGPFFLSGEAKSEKLENEGGLIWRLYCLPGTSLILAESPPLLGSSAWGRFDRSFTVPAENCATQQLRLELNARAQLDYQISGTAFYDNIAITSRDGAQISP